MHEYEADRWRIISVKVGNGFSAAACREKAMEVGEVYEDNVQAPRNVRQRLDSAQA